MDKSELSDRMKELAEKIGELPSTGMIEAERALAITGEALTVLMEVVDTADKHIVEANRLMPICDRLYAENRLLRQHMNLPGFKNYGPIN